MFEAMKTSSFVYIRRKVILESRDTEMIYG